MDKLPKIYSHPLVIEPFQVDCTGHTFPGVLGNHMLGAAGIHADMRGFGIERLNKEGSDGYTWVLSRLIIKMEREWPKHGSNVKISTWIDGVQRLFTSRCFDIKGDDGTVYGYARSIWAMINLQTRHPENLMSVNQGSLPEWIDTERPCLCQFGHKFRINATEPARTIVMRYSDTDINQHVNSMKYIDHMLDLFDIDFMRAHRLAQIEVAFVAESHCGDTLQLFVDTVTENESYNIEMRHTNGTTVCRAHFEFAEAQQNTNKQC